MSVYATDSLLVPRPLLGEETGDAEWARHDKPTDVFLHTESYATLKRPEALFLFGKRGSGKTTLLRMLEHEAREQLDDRYCTAWSLDQDEAYTRLAANVEASILGSAPPSQLVVELRRHWRWVFDASAMLAIVWSARMRNLSCDPGDLRVIERYLQRVGLLEGVYQAEAFAVTPIDELLECVRTELRNAQGETGYAVVAAAVASRLFSVEFRHARRSLDNVLQAQRGYCVVCVDSIDEYRIREALPRAVASAVVQAAIDAYARRDQTKILVKVAFPAELLPTLPLVNAEKVLPRCLFISWRYSQLVRMLAKRYAKHLGEGTPSLLASLNDTRRARAYLYRYFEPTVSAANVREHDTLSYLLRHTHKKPRQVMSLMNTVLTLAERRGIAPTQLSGELLVRGIAARLDIPARGVLDAMKYSHDRAEDLTRSALAGCPSHMTMRELESRLRRASGLRKQMGLDRDDVQRLLLDAGVLGVVTHRGAPRVGEAAFWQALFQYQTTDRLYLPDDATCAVHPMFYAAFNVSLDPNVLVYPLALEDDERAALAQRTLAEARGR